jgi:hypothetical protein
MKAGKVGLVLFSIWCGLEIAVAAWVTAMTFVGRSPPALSLVMSDAKISSVPPEALAVISAQAAIANPCICAVCAMALVLVWRGVARGQRWTWWLLFGTLLPVQASAFGSDSFLGHRNLIANIFSTLFLAGSLALCVTGQNRVAGRAA